MVYCYFCILFNAETTCTKWCSDIESYEDFMLWHGTGGLYVARTDAAVRNIVLHNHTLCVNLHVLVDEYVSEDYRRSMQEAFIGFIFMITTEGIMLVMIRTT